MVINRQQGAIARQVLVKMRLRHFTEGLAIGSKAFIESVFEARRDVFSQQRVDGARKMQAVRWGGYHGAARLARGKAIRARNPTTVRQGLTECRFLHRPKCAPNVEISAEPHPSLPIRPAFLPLKSVKDSSVS